MVTQSTIFSIIILDYQVVIIKHKLYMNIGELALLRNDSNKQASLIFEGVAEIQININLAR
jgi:hypothetical protein